MNFIANHKKLFMVVSGIVVILIIIMSGLSTANTINNEGAKKESELTEAYNASQIELATTVNKTLESMGIAKVASKSMREIMTDAITGRYDGEMQPGTGGAMFSVITEDYPDITADSERYAHVQRVAEAGRDQFKNSQKNLQARISDFNTWKRTGIIKKQFIKAQGFPTGELTISVGGQSFKGQDALDKMSAVIGSPDSTKAFQTGESGPIDFK